MRKNALIWALVALIIAAAVLLAESGGQPLEFGYSLDACAYAAVARGGEAFPMSQAGCRELAALFSELSANEVSLQPEAETAVTVDFYAEYEKAGGVERPLMVSITVDSGGIAEIHDDKGQRTVVIEGFDYDRLIELCAKYFG